MQAMNHDQHSFAQMFTAIFSGTFGLLGVDLSCHRAWNTFSQN
jgi:hypothetical protein